MNWLQTLIFKNWYTLVVIGAVVGYIGCLCLSWFYLKEHRIVATLLPILPYGFGYGIAGKLCLIFPIGIIDVLGFQYRQNDFWGLVFPAQFWAL